MYKICTDIKQSKKLIELGIDINTADMCISLFTIITNGNKEIKQVLVPMNYNKVTGYPAPDFIERFPAWSLSALIWLMPERIKIGEELSFCLTSKKSSTGFSFGYNLNGSTFVKDNPIDAAFEMVCWLLKNNKL